MVAVLHFINGNTLLQNVTHVITKSDSGFIAAKAYYNICQLFYCKTLQLLRNATKLLQNATVISKCDDHYKIGQHTPSSFLPSHLSSLFVYGSYLLFDFKLHNL